MRAPTFSPNISPKKQTNLVSAQIGEKEIKNKVVSAYLAPTTREFLLTSNRRRENVVTFWSSNRLAVVDKSAGIGGEKK